MKFKKLDKSRPNQILYFSDEALELWEFVSYNPLANVWRSETALIYNSNYYIKNGDLRKECEKCKNIEEVKEIFKNSDLETSFWSNNFNELYDEKNK